MTRRSTARLHRPMQGLRTLYIEDGVGGCGRAAYLLRGAGAIFHAVSNPDQAVALVAEEPLIDLVILDNEMPGEDVGWLLRRLGFVRLALPILGTSGTDRRAEFSLLGVEHFLQKPWGLEDLIQVCASLLPMRDFRDSDDVVGTPLRDSLRKADVTP